MKNYGIGKKDYDRGEAKFIEWINDSILEDSLKYYDSKETLNIREMFSVDDYSKIRKQFDFGSIYALETKTRDLVSLFKNNLLKLNFMYVEGNLGFVPLDDFIKAFDIYEKDCLLPYMEQTRKVLASLKINFTKLLSEVHAKHQGIEVLTREHYMKEKDLEYFKIHTNVKVNNYKRELLSFNYFLHSEKETNVIQNDVLPLVLISNKRLYELWYRKQEFSCLKVKKIFKMKRKKKKSLQVRCSLRVVGLSVQESFFSDNFMQLYFLKYFFFFLMGLH